MNNYKYLISLHFCYNLLLRMLWFIVYLLSFIHFTTLEAKTEDCITSNNEKLQCVPLYFCPLLFNAARDQDLSVLERLSTLSENTACNSDGTIPLVCCKNPSNFIKRRNNTHETDEPIGNDKLSRICGLQHSDDYHHTNDSVLSEFPWLARIKYEIIQEHPREINSTDYFFGFLYSGSLISDRYVLTAGSSLTQINLKPVAVRLGEYNIFNKTDYIHDSNVFESNDPEDFDIEEMLVHPGYKVYEYGFSRHDIGLIRLSRAVRFTDYVRPICLPSVDIPKLTPGDILTTTLSEPTTGNIKPKLLRQLVATDKCRKLVFSFHDSPTIFQDGQVCCRSVDSSSEELQAAASDIRVAYDVGIPVMVSRKKRGNKKWYQVGVFLHYFGYSADHVYDKSTNVTYYSKWIRDSISQ